MVITRPYCLIGFMGVGKTTLANLLGQKLQIPAIDLDNFILKEEKVGTMSDLFQKIGEPNFRKLEHFYLNILLENYSPAVISCGGGTPCSPKNIELIIKKSWSIYLKLPPEILVNRLENKKTDRPLIKKLNKISLQQFVENVLIEREYFYTKADITLDISNKTMDICIEELTNILKNFKKTLN